MEELSWNITGDYITHLMRTWFYVEGRDYSVLEELALNCMSGTDQSREQILGYLEDILKFKRKLTGQTIDDTYGLVDEDNTTELMIQYPEYKYFDSIKNKGKISFAECEYGYINPSGMFIPVEWCHHSDYAQKYVKDHNLWEHTLETGYMDCTDYLVYVQGLILLENPHQGRAQVQMPNNITKAQRETLYDYYMYHKREKEAFDLYKEEH